MLDTIKTWVGSLTESIDKANQAIGVVSYRLDNEEKKLAKEREVEPLEEFITSGGRSVEQIDEAVRNLSLELAGLKMGRGKEAV